MILLRDKKVSVSFIAFFVHRFKAEEGKNQREEAQLYLYERDGRQECQVFLLRTSPL
jgi:hypothetical protein